MFGIQFGELLVLMVVALLVFGPDRLPEMAKQAASFIRDLRSMVARARSDLSDSVGDLGIDQEDLKTLADLRNPNSFVRSKLLDGQDLGIDELAESLKGDLDLERDGTLPSSNGAKRAKSTPNSDQAHSPARAATTPPPFDPDAT